MNRPGLSRLAFRTGDFTSFRQRLFEKINQAPSLRTWTYRGSDDPAVALLEGVAMVGDILTAYQEVYANESYLRTAQWEKNVAGLTRLLGARPLPGTGGRTYFSFEIRKGAEIPLRKGFPITSDLEGFAEPVHWESEEALTLIPEFSQLSLAAPQEYLFPTGTPSDSGVSQDLSCAFSDFKEGLPSLKIFIAIGAVAAQAWPTAEGSSLQGETTSILSTHQESMRWILKDVKLTQLSAQSSPREALLLGVPHPGNGSKAGLGTEIVSQTSDQVKSFFTFDGVDASLLPGDSVLVKVADNDFRIRKVEQVRVIAKVDNNLTTIHSLLVLDRAIHSSTNPQGTLNVGGMTLWKIKSSWFQLAAKDPSFIPPATEAGLVEYLVYRGSSEMSKSLDYRKVGFLKADGKAEVVTLTLQDPTQNLYKLSPKLSAQFSYEDFRSQSESRLTTHKVLCLGNVLQVNQGKSEPETVIGSGDSREKYQTFVIPKAPLTYFPSTGDPSRLHPELRVWVQGRLWSRVESFLGLDAQAEVYILREDLEGRSWIQFGDGISGARLPTGADNVTAAYRYGIAAQGPLQRDTQPRPAEKMDRLEKIRQLGDAWGGQSPESALALKHTAPQTIRALGRLVSLDDYEAEVRKIPGVLQVQASWGGIFGEAQNLDFIIFAKTPEAQLEEEIKKALSDLDKKTGLQRLNVKVSFGRRRDAYLAATLRYEATAASRKDLEAAALMKLGVWDGDQPPALPGLFSMEQRTFGQNEYRTRLQAVLQSLPGVRSVSLQSFGVYDSDALLPNVLDLSQTAQKQEAPYKTHLEADEWLALRADQTILVWSEV